LRALIASGGHTADPRHVPPADRPSKRRGLAGRSTPAR
jgi:hypothetical protein